MNKFEFRSKFKLYVLRYHNDNLWREFLQLTTHLQRFWYSQGKSPNLLCGCILFSDRSKMEEPQKHEDRGFIMPYVRVLVRFPAFRYLWFSNIVSLLGEISIITWQFEWYDGGDWVNELACLKVLSQYSNSALAVSALLICREVIFDLQTKLVFWNEQVAPLVVSPFTGDFYRHCLRRKTRWHSIRCRCGHVQSAEDHAHRRFCKDVCGFRVSIGQKCTNPFPFVRFGEFSIKFLWNFVEIYWHVQSFLQFVWVFENSNFENNGNRISSFFGPAVESLIPQIVETDYLSTANIILNIVSCKFRFHSISSEIPNLI